MREDAGLPDEFTELFVVDPRFGLIGTVGLIIIYPLSAMIFALQVVYSRWWLSQYRFGPVEWLWRSLTYGRAQPMRLDSAASA